MKKLVLLSFAFFLSFMPVLAQSAERVSVVELFTSQGCSSCPPADTFLGELAMRKDVLALAFHVDYWDYIGWKDAYASTAYSNRQRHYARQFDLRYIYTPQMVVDGSYETSGTNRRQITAAIEKHLSHPDNISLSIDGSHIAINGEKQKEPTRLVQVTFKKETQTVVRRGENRGRTLSEYNIVTNMIELGQWQGGQRHYALKPQNHNDFGTGLFIQRLSDLKILAAIKL